MKTNYVQNATILVIDDNPINLDVLCNYLTTTGAKVLVKKDGVSGIECAIRKQPDIILLDIIMPDIDGYETCLRLKTEAITEAIPVIFISALVETIDKLKGFELGGVDYITKPIQIEDVLARIETHLKIINLQKQLEITNQRLHKLSMSDGLTQIANRRQFDSYLEQEWQRAMREKQSIALLICDIDYFKSYNDTYGHQGGDDCLKRVAQAIEHVLKRPADLAARYGGEEFGVILPNTCIAGAIEISKQVCQAVRNLKIPHEKSSTASYVTISLGISCVIPEANHKLQDFIKTADNCLYKAKEQGRNQFVESF